jgi:hypothetical protein
VRGGGGVRRARENKGGRGRRKEGKRPKWRMKLEREEGLDVKGFRRKVM